MGEGSVPIPCCTKCFFLLDAARTPNKKQVRHGCCEKLTGVVMRSPVKLAGSCVEQSRAERQMYICRERDRDRETRQDKTRQDKMHKEISHEQL